MTIQTDLLHSPLFDHARHDKDRIAFIHGTEQLSYHTLHISTLAGSRWLARSGCQIGERVAIALPKNLSAIRIIFAALAAGTIIVPIDPEAPPARIIQILADANPRLFVTTSEIAEKLSFIAPDNLPEISCINKQQDVENLFGKATSPTEPVLIDASAPAIFYYTSGTTGTPKAVVLTHANVLSFIEWAVDKIGLHADDRFASHAPLHFDLTTLDLFAAVRLGASTLLLDKRDTLFPARITQLMESSGVTVWYSVPTALGLLLHYGALNKRDLSKLRLVLFAGEPIPVPMLRTLMTMLPEKTFINLYGPTETNVCTYYRVPDPMPEDLLQLPIGLPCEHLTIMLTHADSTIAAEGETGELTVIGPAVMRCYWNNQKLTDSIRYRNIQNSYRTGDFARMGADGNLYLAGRRDDQIKIRGHRLELLEVNAVLCNHPAVRVSATLPTGTDPVRLIAAVELHSGQEEIKPEALRAHCHHWLPAYAVPDEIYILQALPLTSTGKIDRRRLQSMW